MEKNINGNKTVSFMTLGCKVNQYETEAMMAQFEASGHRIVAFGEKSDVYLVNTCTVTNMADKKSRQMLAKAKKNNPDSLVVAVGCYVQAAQDSLDKIEHVDLLIGNTDKGRIVEVVEGYLMEKAKPEVKDLSKYRVYDDLWVSLKQGHTRAHIKVQDGCDQFCSYCIIPYARGRIRSRDKESVVSEVKDLVSNGYKEIVLTGIHLASYATEDQRYLLIDLLEDLDQIEGLDRIRLGSLEPTLITTAFTQRLAKLNHICDHFHLSMQSGDDEVLRRMNRKYTTQAYYDAVTRLKNVFSNGSITTDLIVGFPGESEVEFENTLAFIRKVNFFDLHVFKYSKRDGTKAAKMSDQVNGNVKNVRSQKAMTLAATLKRDQLLRDIGRSLELLIEGEEQLEGQTYFVGHTTNYIKGYVEKDDKLVLGGYYKGKVQSLLGEGLLISQKS